MAGIQEGDQVIVYERHDRMKSVIVRKGTELQNRYGVFRHDDWIGKAFGSRAVDRKGSGFVYLLAPTPVLWTLVLSHRTQILYLADISFVISGLELRPGCVVLESGTGSGSLTTSLARAVAPTGHVHTFDFHEPRAQSAREDFERNRINNLVTVSVRDIQGDGFPEELTGKADAAFLDLPQPWLAVESVSKCLRPNSSCCAFSPCIEQVQRTCEAFRKHKFVDIRSFEILLRTYDVRKEIIHRLPTAMNGTNNNNNGGGKAEENPPQKRKRTDGESDKEGETLGVVMAKPSPETKGHTGFLTFARLRV